MEPTFTFKAKVWLWEAKTAYHFITVPLKISKQIKDFDDGPRRGFGSIPVNVQIGDHTWKTSIFPEKKGTYVLPIKKAIRTKENISNGDTIKLTITLQ